MAKAVKKMTAAATTPPTAPGLGSQQSLESFAQQKEYTLKPIPLE